MRFFTKLIHILRYVVVIPFAFTAYAINTENTGFKVLNTGNTDINVHNYCKNVYNTAGVDHFVSTKTLSEWFNFIDKTPAGLAVSDCYAETYWSNVVLLIQPSADDTTIDDLSNSAHPISLGGNAALSTAIADPWGTNRKVIAFDGAGDYLSIPDSADWYFLGDMTWEAWIYFTGNATSIYTILAQRQNANNHAQFWIKNSVNRGLGFQHQSGGANTITLDEGADHTGGSWKHVAYTRAGNVHRIFVNGTLVASKSDASNFKNYSGPFYIGARDTTTYPFIGYIGGVRLIKGYAAYTANFTPNTDPWLAPWDAVPSTTWANFDNYSAVKKLTGFNRNIDLELSAVNGTGSPTINYSLNGGAWTAFTPAAPVTISVKPNDNLQFKVSGTDTHSATITVKSLTGGTPTVVDTVVGTVAADPYWSNVVLLYMPGVNDTTAVDVSNTPHTLSLVGNANMTSAVPDPWGGIAKTAYLDGVGDWIDIPNSTDFNYGSGDFTLEFWVRHTDPTAGLYQGYYAHRVNGNNRIGVALRNDNNNGVFLFGKASGSITWNTADNVDAPLTRNGWNHVALVRSGNNVYTFIDGVLTYSGTNTNSWPPSLTSNIQLGTYKNGTSDFELKGYLGAVRITKGAARWTTNFTPSTSPFYHP